MDTSCLITVVFDGCTLALTIVVFIALLLRKANQDLPSSLFCDVLIALFFATLFEMADAIIRLHFVSNDTQVALSTFFCSLYFFGIGLLLCFVHLFLIALMRHERLFKKPLFWILSFLPMLFIIMMLILNPILDSFFFDIRLSSVDGGSYVRGNEFYLVYVGTFSYIIEILIEILWANRYLTTQKWASLIGAFFVTLVAIIIQYFIPSVAINLFAWSLSCLLLFLLVLKPEDLIDPETGLPGEKAFNQNVYKLLVSHQEITLMYLKINGVEYYRNRFGSQAYIEEMRRVYLALDGYLRKKRLPVEIYLENPGFFKLIITKNDFSPALAALDIEALFVSDKRITPLSAYGSTPFKCTAVYCPNEISSLEEADDLGKYFTNFIPDERTFGYGSKIIADKNYQLTCNLEKMLLEAIHKRSFEMYYQPIYHIETGRYESAEALLRFHTDEYGFIPPSLFVPFAEKKNLMNSIGNIVLEDVFEFLSSRDFKKLGLSYVEVNLSIEQCMDATLPEHIDSLAKKYGIDPSTICFEITESMYGHNDRLIDTNLRLLKEKGYSFALDDYGTGYSNIERVVSMPLSLIKIDKSLVDSLGIKAGEVLLRNNIETMKDIGKVVVIEGVETEEQYQKVASYGADCIQGFYFSKARPENDFLNFLQMNNSKED